MLPEGLNIPAPLQVSPQQSTWITWVTENLHRQTVNMFILLQATCLITSLVSDIVMVTVDCGHIHKKHAADTKSMLKPKKPTWAMVLIMV